MVGFCEVLADWDNKSGARDGGKSVRLGLHRRKAGDGVERKWPCYLPSLPRGRNVRRGATDIGRAPVKVGQSWSKLVKVGGCASFECEPNVAASVRKAGSGGRARKARLAGAKNRKLAHRASPRNFRCCQARSFVDVGGCDGAGAGQADDAVQISVLRPVLRPVATRSTWGHAIGHSPQPLPAR
jgi:hypothetical protein